MSPARTRLAAGFGLADRLRATAAERRLAADIDAGLERVEAELEAELRFADGIADATARYLLEAGGKRIRPTLALLTAELGSGVGGGATEAVITAAKAVELTHLASLYHDDVMDEAPLRRGVRTAHEVWGNSVAILAGDLLFARAASLVAGLGEEAVLEHARTFERLCLGQLHETIGPQPGEDAEAHYLGVLADKTGSLIAAAAASGIRHSGADRALLPALAQYGERVGVAFQLADDVIDLAEPEAATGKRAGTDLLAGVPTLPVLRLRRLAESGGADGTEAAALVARLDAVAALDDHDSPEVDAELSALVAELHAHPVLEETRSEARRWADAAVAALAPVPHGAVRDALERFATAVVDREA